MVTVVIDLISGDASQCKWCLDREEGMVEDQSCESLTVVEEVFKYHQTTAINFPKLGTMYVPDLVPRAARCVRVGIWVDVSLRT